MATKSTKSTQDTATFDLALKTLAAACGPTPTFILSPATGKGSTSVALSAVSAGAEAVFVIPYEVAGLKQRVEVDTEFFSAALKAVRGGTVTYSNSALVLRNARTDAHVNIADVDLAPSIALPASDTEGLQTFVLTPDLHAFLTTRLPTMKLEKTIMQSPDVMLIIKIRGGKAQLITYEKYQFCVWTGTADGAPDLDLALPYARFLSLIKDLPIANCEIITTPDVLIAKSSSFRLRIALPAVDPEYSIPPDVAYARVKELSQSKGKEVTVPAADLQGALDGAKALISVGTLVHFTPGQKGLMVKISSSKGSTRTRFKDADGCPAFALDTRYLQALLQKNAVSVRRGKSEEEDVVVSFSVNTQGSLLISKAKVTYIAALGVSDED